MEGRGQYCWCSRRSVTVYSGPPLPLPNDVNFLVSEFDYPDSGTHNPSSIMVDPCTGPLTSFIRTIKNCGKLNSYKYTTEDQSDVYVYSSPPLRLIPFTETCRSLFPKYRDLPSSLYYNPNLKGEGLERRRILVPIVVLSRNPKINTFQAMTTLSMNPSITDGR